MGTNVGSINLGLNIDPTAFTKGISSAKTSVKNFFSSVSKDSETAVKTIGISFESARSQVGKLAAEYKNKECRQVKQWQRRGKMLTITVITAVKVLKKD